MDPHLRSQANDEYPIISESLSIYMIMIQDMKALILTCTNCTKTIIIANPKWQNNQPIEFDSGHHVEDIKSRISR